MSWLENIRNKSHEEKMRIIWILVSVVAVLLILIWIISARIKKNIPADTTLFGVIGKGISDIKNNYKK